MARHLAISECDRVSEKSASSSEIMPLSVSASEISGSSSSCDIHYRPLPPIRKKRIRSLLVMKNVESQNRKTSELDSSHPIGVCLCVACVYLCD